MTTECIPLYIPGKDLTVRASGSIAGKTFVDLVNGVDPSKGQVPIVARAIAAGTTAGVAACDAPSGALFPLVRGKGSVVPVTAGGTIAVGAEVEVGSNGRAVVLASGKARGRAWSAGTSGNDVFIELY